jgi:hypothetical protein
VCIDIWHEYLTTVLSHVWLPALLDSLVPFAFLASELLMVHFVGEDLRGWLLGYGLVALIGVAAWVQRNVRIRQFADQDRDLPLSLATGHRYRGALALAVALLGLLGWLLYAPAGLGTSRGRGGWSGWRGPGHRQLGADVEPDPQVRAGRAGGDRALGPGVTDQTALTADNFKASPSSAGVCR